MTTLQRIKAIAAELGAGNVELIAGHPEAAQTYATSALGYASAISDPAIRDVQMWAIQALTLGIEYSRREQQAAARGSKSLAGAG